MPDVVAGDRVTADPAHLRSAARSWGDKASNYDSQVRRLQGVSNKLPVGNFAGTSGNLMRQFLSEMTTSAATLRSAYDQIAIAAPQVADAIQDAKDAQDKRDKAQHELEAKQHELDTATGELLVARIAASVPSAHHAPGEVARAQAKVDRLTDQVSHARSRSIHADNVFADAQRIRVRMSDLFADLVNKQTAVIHKTLPTAPAAPHVPAIVGQLGTLGMGQGALKTLADLQKNLIKGHYNPLDKHGLPLGDLRSSNARVLEVVDKWGKRLDRASMGAGAALSIASNTITAFSDKSMTSQERQDYIVNHVLLEQGGAIAGGTLCAPAGPVAAAGCGYLGGQGGKLLEKSKTVRRVTDGFSHVVVTPAIAPLIDVVHGHPLQAAEDAIAVPGKITYNIGHTALDTIENPHKIVDAGKDVVSDGKGVLNFLDDNVPISPKNVAKALNSLP